MTAQAQLKSVIERIERLEEEKRALAADIKDIYKEAKGNGFDTKALRKLISLRRVPAIQREEADAILDTYMAAIGMLPKDNDKALNRHANGLVPSAPVVADPLA